MPCREAQRGGSAQYLHEECIVSKIPKINEVVPFKLKIPSYCHPSSSHKRLEWIFVEQEGK